MSTLIERLKEVMAAKGWNTPQQLADVSGVSRSAAAQWLGQGSKIIHSIGNMEAAENLERETGYRALWIAKGQGPKFVSHGEAEDALREDERQLLTAYRALGKKEKKYLLADATKYLSDKKV